MPAISDPAHCPKPFAAMGRSYGKINQLNRHPGNRVLCKGLQADATRCPPIGRMESRPAVAGLAWARAAAPG